MTTATAPSAYPPPIEALMPRARALADQLGDLPSRNALMKEFKIGAPKANTIREALTSERTTATTPVETWTLRDQVRKVLDQHASDDDPRDSLALAALVGDVLDLNDTERRTAINHVRVWKHERAASARTLHVVPDLEPDTDMPDPAAPAEAPPVAEAIETPPQATGDGHPDTNITMTDADGLRAAMVKNGRHVPTHGEMSPAAPHAETPASTEPDRARRPRSWPVWVLALPAFVAIWSGWVGLGELTGFGVIHPLPGIADGFSINTAITLPIGVETYAAYALAVWLSSAYGASVRRFARWSAIGSLIFGAAGQVAYHLLTAAGVTSAPWWITTAVACLPVAVLGMGAALAHLIHANRD
ncbi:ABC transporter permease [Dactylosporangium aurantiacum]|uniref:ABC transporter permease n=1 Tax=Dactylosporangium aurantiacum TaxID=35754 RepID=A0A9Q9MEZ7_9ACTN|nr:hypothetical protein [Dactylosporangium aurantiacum]MDG6108144.1 ABC transporter permease [Dactylosporangium aurantiacum]UWZ53859.1 ABC transporter permease [Dactylosporangium aurantiacum]